MPGPTWRTVVERSILRRYLLARQVGRHRTAVEHLRAHVAGCIDAQRQIEHAVAAAALSMKTFVPDFEAVRAVIVEDFDGSSLRAFKDCHRGERCFILGNGPSLQNTDLAPLG